MPWVLTPLTEPRTFTLREETGINVGPASKLFDTRGAALSYLRFTYDRDTPAPLTRLRPIGYYDRIGISPVPYLDLHSVEGNPLPQITACITRFGHVLLDPDQHCPSLPDPITVRSRRESGFLYLYSAPKLHARRLARLERARKEKLSSGSFDLEHIRPIATAFYEALDKEFEHSYVTIGHRDTFYPSRGGWGRGGTSENECISNCLSCIESTLTTAALFKNGLSRWRHHLAQENEKGLFDPILPYLRGMLSNEDYRLARKVALILKRERRIFRRLRRAHDLLLKRQAAYQLGVSRKYQRRQSALRAASTRRQNRLAKELPCPSATPPPSLSPPPSPPTSTSS